ncbi:MAG: hypothetical protein ACR2FJ_07585 [Qipengyuania sp.]
MTTAEITRSGQPSSTSSGDQTKEELKADAAQLKDTAQHRASDEAEKRKTQATRAARSASDALGKAARELDEDQDAPGWLSSAFRETAKGIDSFAGKVESRSPEQMGRDVSRFAREHPTSFLAASATVGFAAARFLRAGADYRQHQSESRGDYSSQMGESQMGESRLASEGRFARETRAAPGQYGESQGGMTL